MARYVLPTFNLDCGIWRFGTSPPAAPALHANGNLSPGEITGVGALESVPLLSAAQVPMFLRLPATTDIRDAKAPAGADNVEVPFGSGRTYDVVFVDDVAAGFANEHRLAVLLGKGPWPVPFPGGIVPPPPPPPPLVFAQMGGQADIGMPVPTLNLFSGIVLPGELVSILVAVMNSTGGVLTCTDGTTVYPASATAIGYTALGIVGDLYLFQGLKGLGGFNYTVTLSGLNFARMSMAGVKCSTGLTALDRTNNAVAATNPPSLIGGGAPTAIPNAQIGGFLNILPFPAAAIVLPFVQMGGTVFNVIGGVNTELVLAAYANNTLIAPFITENACAPAQYGAVLTDWI